nr:integrase, catalytic region, zinc finger, CCHC-type, peptidase aspartic, catalytic [Tanacetum cinerariifolium]
MFDELLNPPPSVVNQAAEVIAPTAEVIPQVDADSIGSPSSTTVDQDAPSSSKSLTPTEIQSSIIIQYVGNDNLDIEVAHMGNDPLLGVPIPEFTSDQSSSTTYPQSNVQSNHPMTHHNSKWTKDHPLNYIIGPLSRPFSTRLQLHEQALFCYYDAFLTSVEPKTYKEALTQACWIEAMQEELNEFERIEVWKLVPRPDKVMVITLKWIYKVKLDELGGILKNKACLVACGNCKEEEIDFEESFAPRNTLSSSESAPTFAELFEINELKAQAQAKDTVILKLKEKLHSLNGDVNERNVKRKLEEIETLNIELDHKEKFLVFTALKEQLNKLKGKLVLTEAVSLNPIDPNLLKVDVAPLVPKLRKNMIAHTDYIRHTQDEAATLREIVERNVFKTVGHIWKPTERTFTLIGNVCPLTMIATPTIVPPREPIPIVNSMDKPVVTLVVQIVLWYLDSGCSKHMTGDRSQLVNFVQKFLGTVKFENDHVAKIMGYTDYQIGNVTISRLYYMEGLGHNLFSVGQFCDSDLEVAFR